MRIIATSLPEVVELAFEGDAFVDERGFFVETYHREKFFEAGIKDTFVQDNWSCSCKGTLRGLHYQLKKPQAKLCRVVKGEVLDIVVDIRRGSPTKGRWAAVVLSAELRNQIYVPWGFAHGFLARTDDTHFLYKCSEFYDPHDEYGISWTDPELAIPWGTSDPLLSPKDRLHPNLSSVADSQLPLSRASKVSSAAE
jgi:dTDP-4-dehydrorhamnose 3,5-epimerase